jgi:hypothetical protein
MPYARFKQSALGIPGGLLVGCLTAGWPARLAGEGFGFWLRSAGLLGKRIHGLRTRRGPQPNADYSRPLQDTSGIRNEHLQNAARQERQRPAPGASASTIRRRVLGMLGAEGA